MLKKAEIENKLKVDEEIRLKEIQHKLEIQEKELRIRELEAEVKSKPQIDAHPPDVLRPANLQTLAHFMRHHLDEDNWRRLGATLGISDQELDQIDQEITIRSGGDKLSGLLRG